MTDLAPPTAAASELTSLPGQASRPSGFLDALAGVSTSTVPLEIVDPCVRCGLRSGGCCRTRYCESCHEITLDIRDDARAEL